MPFFARPNLEDTQFKQLTGSTLTMSGITNFTGVLKSKGIEINATSGITNTNGDVLTLDNGVIKLMPSTSGGSSGIYYGKSPTLCTVGGIPISYTLTGKTISCILQDMLVPIISPALTPNSLSMTLTPTTTLFEVGCSMAFTISMTYNQGSVSPVYCSGTPVRTGAPTCYVFTNIDGSVPYSGVTSICVMPAASITAGNNTAYGVTKYAAGVAPKKSNGAFMSGVTCPASTISTSKVVSGIHPYFWGSTVSAPILTSDACAQCLITGGTKCVGVHTGDVLVTNYNVTGQYIWVAIPATSTTKTKWQGGNSPSNCGTIPGDLMASVCTRNIVSPSSCWSTTSYKIYVSNYGTNINYSMTFKNS